MGKNKDGKSLTHLKILDVGCGGGLVCEPLSRLGASVTGIDASERNINIAKLHAKKNHLKIKYVCSSPEKLKINDKFDVILNMEIIEHVENVNFFLKSSIEFINSSLLLKTLLCLEAQAPILLS